MCCFNAQNIEFMKGSYIRYEKSKIEEENEKNICIKNCQKRVF